MNLTTITLVLFVLGFIPWRFHSRAINSKHQKHKQIEGVWSFEAIFWQYTFEWKDGEYKQLSLTIALIHRLKHMVEAAVKDLLTHL